MRTQKQKRRPKTKGSYALVQRFRQALGLCLTCIETSCDRSLVSKRRLYKLASRPGLRTNKSRPPSPHFREFRFQSHRLKPRGKAKKSFFLRFYPGGIFILSLLIFLNTSGSEAHIWKLNLPFTGQAKHDQTEQPQPQSIPDETLTRLRAAIVQQESDGNHRLLNPSGSGAMGIGQVMPEDLPHWSQEALGREVSQQEFLSNHDLQVVIIDYKLNQYWQQATLQAHGNEDETVKRVASWWYAGNPNLFADTTPQFWNGDEYPSIAEYCNQILARYRAQDNPGG
jgi:hypothetical protein